MATASWRSGLRPHRLDKGDPGNLVVYRGDDPAAGSESSLTVPDGVLWQVLHAWVTLDTDITVANRRCAFRAYLNAGADFFLDTYDENDHAANTIATFHICPGLGTPINDAANQASFLVPCHNELWLPAGATLTTATTLIKAGDNWTYWGLTVREWAADL